MSEENTPARGEEREAPPESGLLLSVEPLGGGGHLSASDTTDAGRDAGDSDASDSSSLLDTDTTDADDSDAGSDVDGTDAGDDDEPETESGLDGQNPLGINPDRRDNDGGGDTRGS